MSVLGEGKIVENQEGALDMSDSIFNALDAFHDGLTKWYLLCFGKPTLSLQTSEGKKVGLK